MSKERVRRYSQAFKQQVVREYEAGRSAWELQQKYGIGGSQTVKRWVKQYGTAGFRSEVVRIQRVEEQDELRTLRTRVQELESALAETVLENRLLHTTLELASASLQLDLKKKYGRP
jgi:transposase-like protein